jgi:hypothetical protein
LDGVAVGQFQWACEGAGEPGDEAGVVAFAEEDGVGLVVDSVVRERVAEALGLGAVVVATVGGVVLLPGPVDDDGVAVVVGVERIPVARIPGVVKLLHALGVGGHPVSLFARVSCQGR